MADNAKGKKHDERVPGTWFQTVTSPDGTVTSAVITFTSEGGLIERIEPKLEGISRCMGGG
jgi:hypothetical protein